MIAPVNQLNFLLIYLIKKEILLNLSKNLFILIKKKIWKKLNLENINNFLSIQKYSSLNISYKKTNQIIQLILVNFFRKLNNDFHKILPGFKFLFY